MVEQIVRDLGDGEDVDQVEEQLDGTHLALVVRALSDARPELRPAHRRIL
jgi:hypothetical protein